MREQAPLWGGTPSTAGAREAGRLAPLVLEWLAGHLAFAGGAFHAGDPAGAVLDALRLSDRQRARAAEALARGEAFWDRVGLRVLVPLGDPPPYGALVLEGVSRAVGPDEAERWLPLLREAVQEKFATLLRETRRAADGRMPRYAALALADDGRRRPPGALLSLSLAGGPGTEAGGPGRRAAVLLAGLWPETTPEWLGATPRGDLFLLPGVDPERLREGLRRLAAPGRRRGLRVQAALAAPLAAGAPPEAQLRRLDRVRRAAEALETAVLGLSDLEAWQRRLGLSDAAAAVAAVQGRLRARRARGVAYLRRPGGEGPPAVELADRVGAEAVPAGPAAAFLLLAPGARGALREAGARIREAARGLWGEAPPVGLSGAEIPTLRPGRLAAAALWAYAHALLLPAPEAVVFDAVTRNVQGDELLAWGDPAGACRAYRAGLRLDPESANLHNSLGVCLGEMGRHAEAEGAFRRAAELAPDDFMAHYNLGGALLRRGRAREAADRLELAWRIREGDLLVGTRLAEARLAAGRPEAALELAAPLARSRRDDAPLPLLRVLGRALFRLGRWPEAREAWTRALARHPEDAETLVDLAAGYLEPGGDPETARRLARQAEDRGGLPPETARRLARLLRRLPPPGTP
ncbi:tetratricopeptide repeat protein [Dissulfurirhabdus thermomarina]|uniref:Tetratricopeptide repeat protein n=1 Tax=Dissulfurirhabdus thermomarina TaxID=1765737 RepID=A0A6N9TNU0_DISTH|nr:tetratricopeptide repeat protein [Dissulfurirhabdus thermomarina]NDY42100.1 tetratricopeptide repeat protein [Dissulfurirhabdus thermomarina]NMX22488.1 tetratricopeptide repeat protein [Dissulfurirhabdus thermomarina]